jgi:hypothetical protein
LFKIASSSAKETEVHRKETEGAFLEYQFMEEVFKPKILLLERRSLRAPNPVLFDFKFTCFDQ